MADFARLPDGPVYRLANARLPACLAPDGLPSAGDGLVGADLVIAEGKIAAVAAPGLLRTDDSPVLDLDHGMVVPCFADVHTHLDKGHIWPRAANPDGSFAGALHAVVPDRDSHWSADDVTRRMDFALRCAFAHGTSAIRTHLDSRPGQTEISWPAFDALRAAWAGRITLEASPLFAIDSALDEPFMASTVAAVRRYGRILGAVTYMTPGLGAGLVRLFDLAERHGWNLDFHVDETLDPGAQSLRVIAEMALERKFGGKILAGHCCALSNQGADEAARTMDLVARAGIGIVALPMCNLYLQDRQAGRTPRMRGVTLLHELAARGVAVMVASDNTRDPFYAYGDLDVLEVLRETTRIAHLDHPHGNWIAAVTATPAGWMGQSARIAAGAPADLVLLRGRTWNETLSRPQADRIVMRGGRAIDRGLPDYRELDDLFIRGSSASPGPAAEIAE